MKAKPKKLYHSVTHEINSYTSCKDVVGIMIEILKIDPNAELVLDDKYGYDGREYEMHIHFKKEYTPAQYEQDAAEKAEARKADRIRRAKVKEETKARELAMYLKLKDKYAAIT